MKDVWIIGDTHFNHKRLILMGVRQSNYSQLIWNNLREIPKTDILIHLGDVCLGKDKEVHHLLNEYGPYRKILVRGNHDHRSVNWYYRYDWSFVCDRFTLKKFNMNIVFTHEPIYSFGYDINIHCHTHGNKYKYKEKYHYPIILENNYEPIPLRKIIENIKRNNIKYERYN